MDFGDPNLLVAGTDLEPGASTRVLRYRGRDNTPSPIVWHEIRNQPLLILIHLGAQKNLQGISWKLIEFG